MIAHLVSFENLSKGTTGMMKTYKEIRKELEAYDKKSGLGKEGLSSKEEIIVLTKTDVVEDEKIIDKKKKEFEKLGEKVFVISLYDDKSIKKFSDELAKILKPCPQAGDYRLRSREEIKKPALCGAGKFVILFYNVICSLHYDDRLIKTIFSMT